MPIFARPEDDPTISASSRPRGRLLALSALLATGLIAAGCGSSSNGDASAEAEDSVTTEAAAESATTEAGAEDETEGEEAGADTSAPVASDSFPAVEVLNLASGENINLADDLSEGTTPVLFWFWAPH